MIAAANAPVSLDELTQLSALPKPTVYRILGLLMRGELVLRASFERRYMPGARLYALAHQVQMHSPKRAQRRAILAQLVDEIGETCNFTMLTSNEVIYLERVETSSPVRLHMEPGSRVPLHCTASGKLFLAQLTPKQLRQVLGKGPLTRYTERTIIGMEELERKLKKVRADGIGTDIGEYLEGSVCVAVPVTDPKGHVCAAVAVHGPAPRMTLKKGMDSLPALKRAAAAIAATLVPERANTSAPPERHPFKRTRSTPVQLGGHLG